MKSFWRQTIVAVGGVALCLSAANARAAEITVAAAADLKFALDEIVHEFRKQHPSATVKVSYGSSGNFYAQIQNGAPFDLYLSADIEYPRRLADAGYAMETNAFLYAIGRLVVWTPRRSRMDVERLGLQALLAPEVKKIAIANPRHAPYGVAAVAAMKTAGIYERLEAKLVFGENVAQTAQFAQSGAADAGIIALSLAVAPQMRDAGRYKEIPPDTFPRLEQGGIVLKGAKDVETVRAFRDFLLGPRGRELLRNYGFFLPEK